MLEWGLAGLGVGVGGAGVAVGPTGVDVGTITVGVGVFVYATVGVGVLVGGLPTASAGETITAITKHNPMRINKIGMVRFMLKHSPYDPTNL